MLGRRQSPAAELSVRPHLPCARLLHQARAEGQFSKPPSREIPPTASVQLASFSQISPVRLSVTVPFPLSVKRGEGQGAPAFLSPSCPVLAQSMMTPVAS